MKVTNSNPMVKWADDYWKGRYPNYRLNYSTGKDVLVHIESASSKEGLSFCGKKLGVNYHVLASLKNDLKDPFICKKCKEFYRTLEIINV